MKDFTESLSYLMKGILTIVENAVENSPRDKTLTGLILAVNTDGTYNLRLDGNIYNNIHSQRLTPKEADDYIERLRVQKLAKEEGR